MNAPLARRDFFALEAGEYLERLTLLVAGPEAPAADALVRLCRALRGAALMSGPPTFSVAAAAVEHLAKSLRDGGSAWTASLAAELQEAVATCQELLRRIPEWAEPEIARCERLAARLNGLVGDHSQRAGVPEPPGTPTQSAAVRAYIARETAALAATLGQAADEAGHQGPAAAAAVSARLQPLRGLGALPGLSPLPELLEALDLTLAQGARSGAWPPGAGPAFRAVAAALARLARDIADLGLPQTESPEVVHATERLREAFADERDVVPIATLFRAGDDQPIVQRGTPPAAPAPAPDLVVELVSLADRLRDGAAQLGHAHGSTRALQLHSLILSLRGLTLSPAVSGSVGNLLRRLDREAMAGRLLAEPERSAALLERASRALVDAAATRELARLGALLAPLCEELDRQVPPGAAPVAEAPAVPIESLAPDADADVVPIESLAPDAEAGVVPIEALGYDFAPGYSAFEQTFTSYFRLLHGAPGAAPAGHAAPRAELASAPGPAAEDAVPVESLLLRGRRALERANRVRHELDAALQAGRELPALRSLLDELLDLVPLALDDPR